MQLSELFDLSLRVYRTLGWKILSACIVPSIFTLAGVAFLFEYVLPGFFTTNQGTKESGQVVEAVMNLALGIFVAGPLMLIGVALATTYIAPLVSDFMHGAQPNFKAAQDAQWRTALRMLWLSIKESLFATSGLIVGALFLFLSWIATYMTASDNVIAGVVAVLGVLAIIAGSLMVLYVISIHAIIAPISAIENVPWRRAGRRSKELMRTRPYQGSGYEAIWSLYSLLGLIVLILFGGTAAIAGLIGITDWAGALNIRELRPVVESVFSLVPYFLCIWVIIPVWAVSTTIIYFERRVRLEGYDIEALAADVWNPDREDSLRA